MVQWITLHQHQTRLPQCTETPRGGTEKRSAHRQDERDRERQRGRHHKLSQAQPSTATHVPRDLA